MDHSPVGPLTVPPPLEPVAQVNEIELAQKLLDLSQQLIHVEDEQLFIDIMHGITSVPADNVTLLYIDNDAKGNPESLIVQTGLHLRTAAKRDRYPISQFPVTKLWLGNPTSATLVPDIMAETQFDENARKLMLRGGQRSMAFVPLVQSGRWVGVLAYLWAEPHTFTPDEEAIFHRLPALVTPIVTNFRAIQELESSLSDRTALLDRTQRMFVLSHLLTTVTDTESFIDILAGITDTPPIGVTLFYIENNAQHQPEMLRFAAGNLPDATLTKGTRIPLSAFTTSSLETLTNPEPILISDVTTHPLFDDQAHALLSRSGTRSMVLVGMQQAGRPIGMIMYYWAEAREFTDNEREIFAQLPSLVTPVVANLHSVEQLEYTLNDRAGLLYRTQKLLELSQTLTTVEDKRAFIDVMYGITDVPASNLSLIYIDNNERGEPEVMTLVSGSSEHPSVPFGSKFPFSTHPASKLWINNPTTTTLSPDVMNEMLFDEQSRQIMVNTGQRSMAVVPLFQANRWIGIISYFWSEPRDFTENEYELFSQLPSLVTPVVANLRSIDELEGSLAQRASLLDRTERLLNVSQMLTTVGDIQSLLEIMEGITATRADSVTLNYIDYDETGEPDTLIIVAGTDPNAQYGISLPLKMMPGREAWMDYPTTPRLISNVTTEMTLEGTSRDLLIAGGNHAMAMVPLFQANRWVGTITYLWNQVHEFSPIEREIFSQLPSLVTPVAANLRVTDERTALLARTERLFNFSQKLTTVSDTRTLVDLLYGITEQPADTMTLNYIDYNEQDQPDIFRVIEGSDASIDFRSLNIVLPLQSSTAAMMWLSRPTQATMTGNILEEAAFDEASRQLLLEGGHHAIAVVPLFQADRWIGNVTYLWENPRQFTAIEQELFDQLPSLVTPVVANLRSVEELEVSLNERAMLLDRTQRLLNFSSLLTTVADKSDLIQIMEQVTESPADLVSLLYIDNDEHGKPEFMTAVTGSNPNIQYGTRIPLNSTPAAHVWLDNPSAPALVSDIFAGEGMNEEARQVFERLRQRAMAVIPLFQANHWVGVVTYQWSEPHEFTEQERELFSQLPSLVTPVVANIRSKEQLQESLQELEIASALARESNRLKSEFLATMSHELRTPMNAIEGFTSIMLSGMGGTQFNEASRRYLERINANSKRLLGLINDFLDLSRIESGRLKLVSIPIAPHELALRWRDQVSGLAQSKNLELNVHIDDALPETVYGDEENISRIAINLLGNAIKFTEAGRIDMRLYLQDKETWALEVKDTGIGIPPHAREFIFDEFRQVDNSSKRQHGGSGLGLAIVQKLTRAMKGNIVLNSEVGEGSTFTILLPTQLDSGISR